MEEENAYKILIEKPLVIVPLSRPKSRQEN
jgi:hypothetical protein